MQRITHLPIHSLLSFPFYWFKSPVCISQLDLVFLTQSLFFWIEVFYPFRFLITKIDLIVLALYLVLSGVWASLKFLCFYGSDGVLQEFFPRPRKKIYTHIILHRLQSVHNLWSSSIYSYDSMDPSLRISVPDVTCTIWDI